MYMMIYYQHELRTSIDARMHALSLYLVAPSPIYAGAVSSLPLHGVGQGANQKQSARISSKDAR